MRERKDQGSVFGVDPNSSRSCTATLFACTNASRLALYSKIRSDVLRFYDAFKHAMHIYRPTIASRRPHPPSTSMVSWTISASEHAHVTCAPYTRRLMSMQVNRQSPAVDGTAFQMSRSTLPQD